MSISTAESEYVDVSGCCAQVLWMRTKLTDYGFFYDKLPIYSDSKIAIAISCNPVQHTRTKHIDVRYHFITDHVEKGTIELYFVGTEFQLADLFTKSLLEARFKFLVETLDNQSLLLQYSRDGYVIEGELKEYEDSCEKSSVQIKFEDKDFIQDFLKIQVAQKKIKLAFENADLSSRVKLIPSEIKRSILLYKGRNYIGRDLLQGRP
ncbi:hypothetical protein Tco_0002977 [Tanacetum coccineum]